jgi:hypothetical protein
MRSAPQETPSAVRVRSGKVAGVPRPMPNLPQALPAPYPLRLTVLLGDVRDFFVSLKLTIVLLVFSMILVFAGTIDQVNLGIWAVQEKYFRAFVVYLPLGGFAVPAFPGGYAIGGLLLLNLVAAHVCRFRLSWKKSGILLTHAGLIVLLVGELLTGLWQEDYHLRLEEGQTKNYAESFRHYELVVIDTTAPDFDDVVAIPDRLLASKTSVQHPKLPFRVTPKTYYPNSSLHMRSASPAPGSDTAAQATLGVGDHVIAAPEPVTYRQDERNLPSAIVEIAGVEGPVGTFLHTWPRRRRSRMRGARGRSRCGSSGPTSRFRSRC